MKTFNQLPSHSKIWIYQAKEAFSSDLLKDIKVKASQFISQWTSHNNQMDATIEIFNNRFIVLGVDEQTAPASGCGIDKSVKFFLELEKALKISLFDRMLVAYEKNGEVFTCSLADLEKLYNTKQIDDNTIVFNNLVTTKGEFESNWRVPLKSSWHKTRITTIA